MKRWFLLTLLVGSCWAQGHVLAPVNGGTGVASPTANSVMLGEGASAMTPLIPGTAGWVLTSNGPGVDPSYQAVSSGSGTVSNCATVGSLAYYAATGTTVGCVGLDFIFNTHTLSAAATAILDLSAATGTAAFKVPTNTTTSADGAIAFDATAGAKNFHVFTGGFDHILVSAASTPTTADCAVWVVSGANVLLGDTGSPCAAGTFTTVNGTTNQIDSSTPSGPSTTLSLSSTLLFPGTITMGASAADFGTATSFKIPAYAGGVTAADGLIAFNTTAKSYHIFQNSADAILASFKTTPTNGQCATWVTDGTSFVLGSVACSAGTVGGTGTANRMTKWTAGSTIGDSDFQNATSTVMDSPTATQSLTYQGGTDSPAGNTVLGSVIVRGADNTSGGGPGSSSGGVWIRGGDSVANNVSAHAGSIEIEPGRDTGVNGQQGILNFANEYRPAGTSTQWFLQCFTSTSMAIQDCGATPTTIAGVADRITTNNVQVHTLGSQTPIAASAAVTLGHTVCAGSTAGKVTDSGGVNPCAAGSGFTLGTVTDVSGTYTLPDGDTWTLSTTLPLIRLDRTQAVGNAANGIAGVVAPIANTAGVISLQNNAATNVTSSSGNGTIVVITTGTQTSGASVKIDANGNHVAGSTTQPYDISITYGKPNAGEWRIDAGVRTVDFAANFSGSQGTCFTNPTAAVTFTIWAANFGTALTSATQLGTASVSTSCVFTFTSVGGTAKSYASGQYLAVQAPVIADPNMQGIAIKLAGTRATQ